MKTDTTILSFRNVCFSYGEQEVLHNISFDIDNNAFLGIVGPNGGGKTTLLKLMLGLEKANTGSIVVMGQNPLFARENIGYVMQHIQYDNNFPATVMDIVLMGLVHKKLLGWYSSNDHKKALVALDKTGTAELKDRSFTALSGGQRQRVLIAQALVANPSMLILDEPTANIDPEGEKTINSLLSILAKTTTIIMVSHNLNTVLNSVSHVLCVNRTAVISSIDSMHPELINATKDGGVAVLHHELNCRIFDKSSGGACA